MRILGLDYGTKTVGVAMSDDLGITAQGMETIVREKENQLRKTLSRIENICNDYSVSRIILGYPRNMDNSIGVQAQKSEEFKQKLEGRTGLEVILWDERLTSISAGRVLDEGNVHGREERKKYVDKLAATFILQGYLDSTRMNHS